MEAVHMEKSGIFQKGSSQEYEDKSSPVEYRDKATVGRLGDGLPEATAKCEISVQFFTFSCTQFII